MGQLSVESCESRAYCEVIKLGSCSQGAPEVSTIPADPVYEGVEDLHGLLGLLEAVPWEGDRQDGYGCMDSCSGPAFISKTYQLHWGIAHSDHAYTPIGGDMHTCTNRMV